MTSGKLCRAPPSDAPDALLAYEKLDFAVDGAHRATATVTSAIVTAT